MPRPQIAFALLSALFTACAANDPTPEAPQPEGWQDVSEHLVTVVRESRSASSQWLVEEGTDQQFDSLSTITFQYRVRESIPLITKALLEAAEICGAHPAVNS